MNPQQLHDYIIKPTLEYMSGNYNSIEARFLLLCTSAIESDCGKHNFQIKGPALSWWQIEPRTHTSVWFNCDALENKEFAKKILHLSGGHDCYSQHLLSSCPMYACAIARLIYSMTPEQLPEYTGDANIDLRAFYDYYAKFYHGVDKSGKELGKSNYTKWATAIARLDILNVDLGE